MDNCFKDKALFSVIGFSNGRLGIPDFRISGHSCLRTSLWKLSTRSRGARTRTHTEPHALPVLHQRAFYKEVHFVLRLSYLFPGGWRKQRRQLHPRKAKTLQLIIPVATDRGTLLLYVLSPPAIRKPGWPPRRSIVILPRDIAELFVSGPRTELCRRDNRRGSAGPRKLRRKS